MKEILLHLKKHGEQMDTEIAAATRMSHSHDHLLLTELTAKGEIMTCQSTRFDKGRKIEGIICRISGYIPPAKPGAKSKAQLTLS